MMDNKTFMIVGIIIALLIGVVAVFMASGDPDGLESTALIVQGQKDAYRAQHRPMLRSRKT